MKVLWGTVLAAIVAIVWFYNNTATEFDLQETTIKSIHKALFKGQITCARVVDEYIERINKYDHLLHSVHIVNSNAKKRAIELDKLSTSQKKQFPLFCVPILVKDNIDTYDMPTTAGSLAMVNCTPTKDAFVVSKLRSAGAIILGKNHLNEFAFQGISRSSLGGQVRNPYDLTRTPGGSSGGTGASIAANFAMLGIGTDTMNSVRSPASACGCVGFRATRGLVSRGGVCPVSWTQDQLGPIGRSVEDVMRVFEVMSGGYDERDNITSLGRVYDLTRPKSRTTLNGLRLGVLTSYINHTVDETSPEVSNLFEKSVIQLRAAGVRIITIDEPSFHPQNLSKAEVLLHEFHQSLNTYLSQPSHSSCPSISSILTSPFIDSIAVGPTWELNLSTSDPGYSIRLAQIEHLKLLLARLFAENELDGLVYPHQTVLVARVGERVQSGRNGLLTSLTGTPGVVVPMGMSTSSESAKGGVPAGMEVVGLWGMDWKILEIAKEIEQKLNGRRIPAME